MKLSEFDQARSDIVAFVNMDPELKSQGDQLLSELSVLEKKQEKKSKAMFEKFFK